MIQTYCDGEFLRHIIWSLSDYRVMCMYATALVLYAASYFFGPFPNDSGPDHSPPRAPVGILEILDNFSRGRTPWFLEEVAEMTQSDIYQLTSKLFIVGDADAAREILLDKLSLKPKSYSVFVQLFGTQTMFSRTTNGELWHNTRKAISRAFSSGEVNRMNQICLKHVENWIHNVLEPSLASGDLIDPSHEMSRITFKIILEATMEYTATDEDYEGFVYHLDIGMKEVMNKNVRNPLRAYYAPFVSSKYRTALKSCEEIQVFGRKVLDSYRKNKNKSHDNTAIKLLEFPGACVDDKHRVAEIVSLIFAGHDTSGFTLGNTLVLLAKHPEIQAKLRSELCGMDAEQRPKSEYMKHVIAESNRLLPVVPLGSVRQVGRDISCKNGTMIIPKGSVMYIPQMLLHRNPAVFKDPKNFHPDRWEKPSKAMKDSLTMFSLGMRNCPGQSLGMAELHSMIPRLLVPYTFELEAEGELEFATTMRYASSRLKVRKVEN